MFPAIDEVDDHADGEPDNETGPIHPAELVHHIAVEQDAERGDERRFPLQRFPVRPGGLLKIWARSLPAIGLSIAPSPLCPPILSPWRTKAYSNTFELVHRREADGPNAIWQADHTPLDIWLLRPDGEAAKPWLSVVIDDYSRAVAGYFLSFEDPSALHPSLALRQAIWRKEDSRWIVCGIPDVLYTDNGSDFTSQHLEQVSADLKIRLVFSIPGKPRGRGRIERFFSTVNEMFLCELDGYVPGGGAGVRGKPRLTLAEFDALFRTFLLDVCHRRECTETKTPPVERGEANGFLPGMPDSLEQPDLLPIQVAGRAKCGWMAFTSRASATFRQRWRHTLGETATPRFDPRDMAEIRVSHEDTFLCRAVCAEPAGATVPLREILRARDRQRRELRGVLRDRQIAVNTLLDLKRGEVMETKDEPPSPTDKAAKRAAPALKRYRNA